MATDNPPGLDYRQLGLICGIEIHQQLDTACKLFCGCPTAHREVEDSNFEFFRYLRPSRSELGEIDRAALEEVLVSRKFHYKCYDTTCLVEADEEPPSQINLEALEISLVIARLLSMQIVDEVCTMRKMGHRHTLPGGGGCEDHRGPGRQPGLLPRSLGHSFGGDWDGA